MTEPSQSLQDLIAAERSRPEPPAARADAVWSKVQTRLDGAPAPTWVSESPGPWWPRLVGGIVGGIVVAAVVGLLATEGRAEPRPFVAGAPSLPTLPDAGFVPPTFPRIAVPEAAPPPVAEAPPTRPKTPARTPGFDEELALIERGRHALAAKRFPAVVAAMREHAKTFPGGVLREEAAALRAAAECGQGTPDGRLDRFTRHWPRSVHTDLVRRHCQ